MPKENKIRQGIPDLLKGIAVLLMIQVHLMELFALPELYASYLGKVSLFLGGAPAAPTFMLIMGYYVSLDNGVVSNFKRGVKLITLGFALNILLNIHLLLKIYQGKLHLNPWEYLLGVDILFLAGLSLIFITCLHLAFKKRWYLFFFISVGAIIISPYIQEYFVKDNSIKYLLAYFGGKYSWSYFAFFPWVAYPIMGYGLKLLHQQTSFIQFFLKKDLIVLILLGLALIPTLKWAIGISYNLHGHYYHHNLLFFTWVLAFVSFWALLIRSIEVKKSKLNNIVRWIGQNVTVFYIVQWILIGNIATGIYKTQSFINLIIWYFAITIICILVVRYVFGKRIVFLNNHFD